MRFLVSIAGKKHELELTRTQDAWECRLDGRPVNIDVQVISPGVLSVLQDGKSYTVRQGVNGAIVVGEHSYEVSIADPRSWRSRQLTASGTAGPQRLTASMPGKVVRVLVKAGDSVEAGQGLLVVEAMKMQNEIRSPKSGTVERVPAIEGQAVNAGEVLCVVA